MNCRLFLWIISENEKSAIIDGLSIMTQEDQVKLLHGTTTSGVMQAGSSILYPIFHEQRVISLRGKRNV